MQLVGDEIKMIQNKIKICLIISLIILLVIITPIIQVKAAHPKIDSVLGGYLPNFQIGIETTPAYDKDEITATPNETAAYNAGYSHGYLGLPLGKHHTEQFILGYINGTQAIENNKADVAGVLGLKFHGNDEAMNHYKDGKVTHLFVKCGANSPIGTLPIDTSDNYTEFWIGYNDGAILRDNSDPSGNVPHFGDCPSNQTSEFCAGWKFGWYNEEALINPPDPSDPKCYPDSIKQPDLIGTWNMVNESKKPTDLNNTITSGSITFTKQLLMYQTSFLEHINGRTYQGTWEFNDPTNMMIILCRYDINHNPIGNCAYLTFATIKHNFIELQEGQQGLLTTIYLIR
jgi:hypothetical protein